MNEEIKAGSVDTIQFRSLLNECEWQEYVARTSDSASPTDWSKQDAAEATLIAHINAWSDERCNAAINQLAASGAVVPSLTDEQILTLAADHHLPVRFPHETVAFGRALLALATPVAGWVSVEERLPEVGELVMVYSPPTKYDHPGEVNISFDCIDPNDDDAASWLGHNEHYEHYCCVAKPEGSTGPSEKAPYTHWQPIPAPPAPVATPTQQQEQP